MLGPSESWGCPPGAVAVEIQPLLEAGQYEDRGLGKQIPWCVLLPSSASHGWDPTRAGGQEHHRSQPTGHRRGLRVGVGVGVESDKG